MRRRRRSLILGATVAAAALALVLLTRPGSTAGPWDGWGCPPEQIGTSTYDFPSEASGYPTPDAALRAEAEFQATDGALEGDQYLEALGHRSGSTRYDPKAGELYLDGDVYARFRASELDDGTWIVAQITNCGPRPPVGDSPGPTPA